MLFESFDFSGTWQPPPPKCCFLSRVAASRIFFDLIERESEFISGISVEFSSIDVIRDAAYEKGVWSND